MIVSLIVPGEPHVKERPRCGKRVRSTAKQKAAEAEIARLFQAKYIVPDLYDGPVFLELYFCTKSKTKDIDNMLKLVMDSLNGVLWRDDRQVTTATVTVNRFAVEDVRTEITAILANDGAVLSRECA